MGSFQPLEHTAVPGAERAVGHADVRPNHLHMARQPSVAVRIEIPILRLMRILSLLLCAAPAFAQQYDLLLKGGHVIDPKNDVNAILDVAIKGDRVAAVLADIPSSQAGKVID